MTREKREPGMPASTPSKARRLIDGSGLREGVRADVVASLYPKSFRIGTSYLTGAGTKVTIRLPAVA
jgi:hypothetical protein